MHRTIVVAAGEHRPLHDAFALGVALARPRGAGVVLAHVDVGGRDVPVPARLTELAADAPVDVPARAISVTAPSVTAGLHRAVADEQAEVLVLGTSHVRPLVRAVRRDVALGAVRDAPCAIAVAPLGYAAKAPVEPRDIGVAWDGSAEAREALEWAVQLAERTGGHVRLIHVLHEAEDDVASGAELQRLRHAVAERVPASVELRRGRAAETLAGGDQPDLLVLGSRRRGPIERVALGSVSAGVMHRARCPVVVLPRGVYAPVQSIC